MKLLIDSCVWGGAVAARALAEDRVLVTLDKDFGELVIAQGLPHGGIIRLANFAARQQAKACLRVLSLHSVELAAGALVTAEPGVVRVRLPQK
jgi:predicted nuclease of predicted toxin-antitoxin system